MGVISNGSISPHHTRSYFVGVFLRTIFYIHLVLFIPQFCEKQMNVIALAAFVYVTTIKTGFANALHCIDDSVVH